MGAGIENTRSGVHDGESGGIRVTNIDMLTHGPAQECMTQSIKAKNLGHLLDDKR